MTRLWDGRLAVGWLYKEDPNIIVDLPDLETGIPVKEVFEGRSNIGATKARDHITQMLGRDDWALEKMGFLGYRIILPGERGYREKRLGPQEPTAEQIAERDRQVDQIIDVAKQKLDEAKGAEDERI